MKKVKLLSILCAVVFVLTLVSGAVYTGAVDSEIPLYVAPNGNDGNSGAEDSPFATLAGARDAIRKMEKTKPITVYVKGGVYDLTETFVLDENDSGNENCLITYKAAEGEDVVLSGAVSIPYESFKKLSAGDKALFSSKIPVSKLLVCDLKACGITDFGSTRGSFNAELIVNNERQTIAQYPNKGEFLTFHATSNENVPYSDNILDSWKLKGDEYACGYFGNDYSFSVLQILSIDTVNNVFTMEDDSYYGYTNGAQFFFSNNPETLDAPGEYYLDRATGKLYYYPSASFNADAAIDIISNAGTMISVAAEYVRIEGFDLFGGNDGISVSASNVTICKNAISALHGTGVSVRGDNIRVESNHIFGIGGSGVSVYGGNDKLLTPSRNYIYNNSIHDYGDVIRTYVPGISCGATGCYIGHNKIYNAPHEAIEYNAANVIIEYNEIYNVCLETGDAGAIYEGRRWDWEGSRLNYNYIHDIGRVGFGRPTAIYWDDALSGQTAYGNIITDVLGNGFLIGGGRNNKVINNIVINCGVSTIQYDARAIRGGWASGLAPFRTGMWKELMLRPYNSKLWYNKFSILSLMKESYANNPEDIDASGNNSYAVIKNNIFAEQLAIYWVIPPYEVFSTVRDNKLYVSRTNVIDVSSSENGKRNISIKPRAFYEIDGFKDIPFNDIGLVDENVESLVISR